MAHDRLIAAIFIPHEGCPYRCVFCNQKDITGVLGKTDRDRVEQTLKTYLRSGAALPLHREAAFYGGSFTGLPLPRQESLLSLIQPWIDSGEIHAIRVSTHPLFIDSERLALLKKYKVATVEMGIQSTDANVLKLSGRECPLSAMKNAVELIRANGFRLGLQLMSGLPGDNDLTFQKSVDDVIRWRPQFVRLYPTLVIRHTPLHEMYLDKRFVPWSLEQTIESLKTAVLKFTQAGIPVTRLGLHPEPSLLENFVAGPYHPALRYLVDSRICLDRMIAGIKALAPLPKTVVFSVPSKYISTYTGNKRENIHKLKDLFHLDEVRVQEGLARAQIVMHQA
jgi:histone acetyltransferase (RNA polymerase elongator complex component)